MNTAQIAERAYVIQAATDGTADEDIREIVIAAVYDDARDDPEMAKMSAIEVSARSPPESTSSPRTFLRGSDTEIESPAYSSSSSLNGSSSRS